MCQNLSWGPGTPACLHCWMSQECGLIAGKNLLVTLTTSSFTADVMIFIPTLRNVSSWLLRASTLSPSALPKWRSGNIFFGPLTSEIHKIYSRWYFCLGIQHFKGHLRQRIISYSWLLSWLRASPLNVSASWGTRCISGWQCEWSQAADCHFFLRQPMYQTVKQTVEGTDQWHIFKYQSNFKEAGSGVTLTV